MLFADTLCPQRASFPARRAGGVAAGTLIVDPRSGRRVSARELAQAQEGAIVAMPEPWRLASTPIIGAFVTAPVPAIRVVTDTGRSLEASAAQTLLSATGWVPLGDIEPGTELAIAAEYPPLGASEGTSDVLLIALAILLARGEVARDGTLIVSTDDAVVRREIIDAAEVCGDDALHLLAGPTSFVRIDGRRGGASKVASYLRRIGLLAHAGIVRAVPELVFGLDGRQQRVFLGRLLSAGARLAGPGRIVLTAPNADFLADVQHLLARAGVVARVEAPPPGLVAEPRLCVRDLVSMARLLDEIPLLGTLGAAVPAIRKGLGAEGATEAPLLRRGAVAFDRVRAIEEVDAEPQVGVVIRGALPVVMGEFLVRMPEDSPGL